MRRATAIGLMGLTMIVLSARPASAQWEWFKWIQELSGPGPFVVNGPTISFSCTHRDDEGLKEFRSAPAVYRGIQCDRIPGWTSVRTFLMLTVARGDGHNNLDYPSGREKLERVSAWLFRFAGAYRSNRFIDVGAGAGMIRLSGTPDVFVIKGFVEPFVSLRPFAALADGDADVLARSIDLTFAVTVFPQGFRLSDFGAIGGADLTGDPEFLPRIGIRVAFTF
jgi:hypothetical protein